MVTARQRHRRKCFRPLALGHDIELLTQPNFASRLYLHTAAIMRRSTLLLRPLRSALSAASRPLLRPAASAAALSAPARALPRTPAPPLRPRWASTEAAAPSSVAVSVEAPDLAAIKEEGFIEDPELVPAAKATLAITPEATAQLAKLKAGEPADTPMALRVGVDSGGCHGYQYIMELTEEKGTDD